MKTELNMNFWNLPGLVPGISDIFLGIPVGFRPLSFGFKYIQVWSKLTGLRIT